ncbi:MAG: DUF3363 domain-containing protein, partial [Pseudomonadota bacterium]
KQSTRFVSEVMRAARKSGQTGYRFGSKQFQSTSRSFGRGLFRRAALNMSRTSRRVVINARVVRHQGKRFRSAPMVKHLGYLQRDGVGQDGRDADLFGAESDDLDRVSFAERCEDDRHHFRFIVSPEDAIELEDLRAFTRDLMARAERDLGTTLDWVAVDHWNTDNPHVHILVRGKAEDGRDLVISRDYISRGFRARAEDLVQLELGPRCEREISNALETQVTAERWTDLDRGLRSLADDHAGIADLRPGAPEPRDPELRRLMIGRAQTLERLGLAEQCAPAVWELKPNAEETLRELGLRGDIIKRMHRAMGADRDHAAGDFAIEGNPAAPILGRLVERGFHDDHAGTGYAILDGVDGRVHHLHFRNLDATGDTPQGGIVETRLWTGKTDGTPKLSLVGRSDLSLGAQIEADGATWLDRLHLARDRASLSGAGFGAEVRQALERRSEHLVAEGLARRQGQRVTFARDLLATLRNRELDAIAQDLSTQTGLPRCRPTESEPVAGTFRQRLDLASGRFAMIDDGLGFSLVPWTPQLERHLGQTVTGTMTPGGRIDWSLGRKRGLSR